MTTLNHQNSRLTPQDPCPGCTRALEKAVYIPSKQKRDGLLTILFGIGALCLSPLAPFWGLVGVLVLLSGLHYSTKRKHVWRCTGCETEYPRKRNVLRYG